MTWCARSQCIGSHNIDLVLPRLSFLSTKGLSKGITISFTIISFMQSDISFVSLNRNCHQKNDNWDRLFSQHLHRWLWLGDASHIGLTTSISYFINMLLKFLTSANQKLQIWSGDESGLCNPRPRLLGDEVVVGSSLMFRKMDPWNVIRNILQDKTNKKSTAKRNGTLLVEWHFW